MLLWFRLHSAQVLAHIWGDSQPLTPAPGIQQLLLASISTSIHTYIPTRRHMVIHMIKMFKQFLQKRVIFQCSAGGKVGKAQCLTSQRFVFSSNPVTWQAGVICLTPHKRKTPELNNSLTTEEKTMRRSSLPQRAKAQAQSPPKEDGQNQSETRLGRELGCEVGGRLGSSSPRRGKPHTSRQDQLYQGKMRGTGFKERRKMCEPQGESVGPQSSEAGQTKLLSANC